MNYGGISLVIQNGICFCTSKVNGKVVPVLNELNTIPRRIMEKWRYRSTILDVGSRWSESSASSLCCFTHREIAPGTHWIGGRVNSRADLDAVEKREKILCWESNTDLQPLACRYTLVRSRVRELVRALQLHVGTCYKCSINPINNPNPVCSHEHMTVVNTRAHLHSSRPLVLQNHGIWWPSTGQLFNNKIKHTEVLGFIYCGLHFA
jgi:hypothetical protein